MTGSNYPDGMTRQHWEAIDSIHCPACEADAPPMNGQACDDDDAHRLCADHEISRDEYLADRTGL